jgi:hypothetical protein
MADILETGTDVTTEAPAQPPGFAPSFETQIRPFAAIVAAAAWVFFIAVTEAVAPPPDPDAAPGALAVSISLVFTLALFGAIAGLAMRQRWGLWATAAGGGLLVFGSLVCFAGGHTGLTPLVQLGSGVGLASAGLLLARSPFANGTS